MCTCKLPGVTVAVSNRHLSRLPYLKQIERICSLHPQMLILREKDLSEEEYRALALNVLAICRRYEVPCILHTFTETARFLETGSIHLPLPLLRVQAENLTDFPVIGTSVHSVEEALEAQNLGATYITAGHIYVTDCKKGLAPRGLSFLKQVCNAVSIPVYAIGGIGINETQFHEITSCGASGGCIMSGLMQY